MMARICKDHGLNWTKLKMGCGTKLERITSTFIYEQRSSRSFHKSIHWFPSKGFIVISFFSRNGIYVDFYGQKFIYEAVNSSYYRVINHILLPFCANFCFKYWKKKWCKKLHCMRFWIDDGNVDAPTNLFSLYLPEQQ